MNVELVTSMSLPYCRRVGKWMLSSYASFVDGEIGLRLYHEVSAEGSKLEEYAPIQPRVTPVDLHQETRLNEFLKTATPKVSARIGYIPSRNPEERLKNPRGYNYLYDALTFGRKAFAFIHAGRNSPARYVFWVDADVVFKKPVPASFFIGLMSEAPVAYFPRTKPHAETGFFGIDKNAPAAMAFVEEYATFWEKSRIFGLPGWTDSNSFDAAVKACKGLKTRALSSKREGPVMDFSVLSEYMEHKKGIRKLSGTAKHPSTTPG